MLNNPDKKLEQVVNEYQQVATENPEVNLSLLMINALQTQKQNLVSTKIKRWAYLISLGLPPLGILFAAKYFFSDEDDAQTVAWVCVTLTVVSVLAIYLGGKILLSGSGTSVQQIQQIKPSDVMQLGQ
ncbi:MAG: hypothetical protein WC794_04000 [Candidatus Doudnabacteria bacterium]|jgi:hypothetical protein